MPKNHQFLGLTTCLTTYKKSNNFTISRCSEGGIAHRSGRWDRRFESCHFDQKTAENKLFWLVFGCFSICFSQKRLFSIDHMFALISNLWTAFYRDFSFVAKKPFLCLLRCKFWGLTDCFLPALLVLFSPTNWNLSVLQLLNLIGNHSHVFGVGINFNGIACLIHRYSCYASLNCIFRTDTSFYIHC